MTYARLFYHIVWATKNREPVLEPDIEEKIFSHIQKKANFIGCMHIPVKSHTDSGIMPHTFRKKYWLK